MRMVWNDGEGRLRLVCVKEGSCARSNFCEAAKHEKEREGGRGSEVSSGGGRSRRGERKGYVRKKFERGRRGT
jgi:hypothetical protein